MYISACFRDTISVYGICVKLTEFHEIQQKGTRLPIEEHMKYSRRI